MGIDKPDVRLVVHHTMAHDVEAFYQQFGRAGRDGQESTAVTFYHPNDVARVAQLICGEMELPSQVEKYHRLLDLMDLLETKGQCRNAFLSEYFGEARSTCSSFSDVFCDSCSLPYENATIDLRQETNSIIQWLMVEKTVYFDDFCNLLKGIRKTTALVCGLFSHWRFSEIKRIIRFLIRRNILQSHPVKERGRPKIETVVSLNSDSAEILTELPFPLLKTDNLAIANSKQAAREKERALFDPNLLTTQSREIIDNALSVYPDPPTSM